MTKTATEVKAGDIVMPFLNERTMKRTKDTYKALEDAKPASDKEPFSYYVIFKAELLFGAKLDNDEVFIHGGETVEIVL